MIVNRFGGAELVIYQEDTTLTELDDLLTEWGVTNATQERMVVVTFDSVTNIRLVQEIAKGGYHDLTVPLPPLLTSVLLSGTDRFQIVHNHPSGDTSPTNLDVQLTAMVMNAANTVGLFFEDHLIVGPDAPTFSFVRSGLIQPAAKTLEREGDGHRRAAPAA